MVTPAAHREAAAHLQSAYEMSERRACRVLGVDRTSVRYQATRAPDTELRERLRTLAQECKVAPKRDPGFASKRDPFVPAVRAAVRGALA